MAGAGTSLLRRALAERNVAGYLIGSLLSNIGLWIQRIAIGWLVYNMTGSAGWVGAIAACELVPSLLVAPYGGVLADRYDRFGLLMVGLVCAQAQALMLAALAASGLLGLAPLAIASIALGMVEGISQPSRLSLVADVAPRDLLPATVSLNSLGFNVARFIGPMVAAVALSGGSPVPAFLLNALSFVPLILLLVRLRRVARPSRTAVGAGDGFLGGVRYTMAHRLIGPILLLLVSISLSARAMIELLPAIAGSWFGPAPEDLARLSVSVAVGAMAGGLWMLHRRDPRSVLMAVAATPIILVAAIVGLALFGRVGWVAYPLLAVTGFLLLVSGSGTQSLIHVTADPGYRGRVLSMFGICQRAAPATGALVLGLAADRIGLGPALLLAAGLAFSAWLWTWLRRRELEAFTGGDAGS